ncbi:MAG: hypothetical protein ACRERC_20760 [Candidatus Binatia bacterium]
MWRTLPALLAVALAAVAMFPITRSYFHFDDFVHLYDAVNDSALTFILKSTGGHLYLTRNVVFLAAHALFGTEPAPYMWMAFLTHLLNVLLLYWVTREMTGNVWLACFAAALWGTHPLNEGAAGWYSVYGHVLAVTFILWVLLQVARVANGRPCGRLAPWLWGLALIGAGSSFGVGIGMSGAMPVVARLLLPPGPARRRIVLAFAGAVVAVVVLYLQVEAWNIAHYGGFPSSAMATGDLTSRLRMLRFTANLLGVGIPSLLIGAPFLPDQYPSPLAWGVVALFAVALGAALLRASWAGRRQLVAALLLCAAAYFMIAAGRSLFAADPHLAVILIRSSRYHYAAPVGLALASALILGWLGRGAWLRQPAVRSALLAGWVAALAVGYVAVPRQINAHDHQRKEVARIQAKVRDAVAAAAPGADVYIDNGPFFISPIGGFVFPGEAGVFVIYFPENRVDGRRVYFVEADANVRDDAAGGRRSGALLVDPEARPPAAAAAS